MTFGTFLAHARRESRGGGARLVFFIACLALGVGAVVSVSSFADALDRGVRGEARQLLAADLSMRGRQPIGEDLRKAVAELPGSETADVLEMLTVVAVPSPDSGDGTTGASQLVELKVVDGGYPFYGDLELRPAGPLAPHLGPDTAVVGPELLRRLGVDIGDTLRIGGEDFQISAVVEREPDRVGGAFSMGPRVLLSAAGLERAGLEQYGSRIVYRLLVKLPVERDAELETLAAELEALAPDDGRVRVETYREAQPALRQGMRRMESYLGLAALLSLLVGGVGVAQTVRTWLAGRLDAIAVLKCLGYRPREVLALYLGQTALLGLVGSVVGVGLGVGLQLVAARLLEGILPVESLALWQPAAWFQGLLLGVGVSVLFSIAPLVTARRVPPVRVLRRSAEPLPASGWARWGTGAVLLGGTFALAWWQARSPIEAALFVGGLVAVTAVLTLAALALTRFARRPRSGARLWLRHGLSALARPGASTLGAIVGLGLGVLVVLAMFLVERGLVRQLDQDLPEGAPTAFFIDIQPDQWDGVREILERDDAEVGTAPVVMARIASLDGRDVSELVTERETRAEAEGGDVEEETWALRRELRLTYLDQLPEDNEILEGTLWGDPEVDEISVETEFAENLGVGLGSRVVLDIQGVQKELRVTSLRQVDWSTFGINFFMVVEPGVLESAPQFRLAAARLSPQRVQEAQDELAVAYPNVTVVQIREVLERVTAILSRLGLGVRLLGSLTVIAGLAILAGAVSAGAVRRGAEVALYKTLGMTRRQVVATYATEYALVGLVAGIIGTIGGGILAYAVLTRGMEVDWAPVAWHFPLALGVTVALSVGAGLVASLRALQRRPIEVLRAADAG
ncbi:MAG: FtsX-like permease family protein [Acidobacteriota bacterium]